MSATISYFSKIYHSLINFFSRRRTYTAFLLVAVVGIVAYGLFSGEPVQKETYTVSITPIKQSVKVSGQVQASKDANLAFQASGAVAYVGVKTGDRVQQGKVLATLSGGDSQAALLQAQAALANATAISEQLQQGSRKEEIAIKEQTKENAKSSLDQAYSAIPDAIQNVDAVTADVVKNKFSSLFVNTGGRYQLAFSSCDQRLQGEVEAKRTNLEDVLANFQTKSTVITTLSSIENVDSTFTLGYQAAIATNDLVNSISNLLLLSCSAGNSGLDGARTILSTVKTTMTGLFSDISTKRSALIVAKNAYSQASRDLELALAGTDPYKIKAQKALVAQAEAQVASAQSGLSKTIIVAPFTGVVGTVDLSLGETVSIGKTVVSMIATDGYEVEAKIPEIDIVKVKVGQLAEVTLDAYGKDIVFPATITRINPTATTEGTVPVYKVIVTFTGKDDRIRQGMTATMQIITETKVNSIAIPARFVTILTSEEGTVVVARKEKEETVKVTLGIRGTDGLIEVKDGLHTDDVLVAPQTTSRQAQKQTN